ncbi:MAG: YfhO family protein [Chloroflexi bacterium]|nr:YfhO family protein [Chloroflexota bacterium]
MGELARGKLKPDLGLAALLFGLSLLLFWKLVFTGDVLHWGTPLLQFFPWRKFAVESYLAGQVPLWNPYLGNGTPLAANLQSAVFYPLNVIFLFFSIEKAMGYSVVLHVGLAGIFMYVFGRVLGLSRFASFVSGLSYAFGGFLISRAEFLSMTSASAWLPLELALAEAALRPRERDRRRTTTLILLGALAVSLQLLAGHAQLSFYSLILVVLYTLCRAWQFSRLPPLSKEISSSAGPTRIWLKPLPPVRACLPVLTMLCLGIGLAAIQLLPTAELAVNSVRSGGAEYEFAMNYSLVPWQLAGLLAPDFFGNPGAGNYWGPGNYWEAAGYVGVFPLLAASVGLLAPVKLSRAPRIFLLGTIAVSLLFALGRFLPVYPFIFGHVPGFSFFQAPARFLFLYTLAAGTLAGIGTDSLLTRAGSAKVHERGKIVFTVGIGIGVAMVALGLVVNRNEEIAATLIGSIGKLGGMLALSGLAVLFLRSLPRRWWQLAVGMFVAADLIVFGFPLNPTTQPQVYDSGGMPLLDQLGETDRLSRIYTPDSAFLAKFYDTHSFRTFGSNDPTEVKAIRDMATPDTAMAAGLYESYNYDPLKVGSTTEFLKAVDASGFDGRLLGLMNVRYVLSDTLPANSDLRLALLGQSPAYENPDYLERAYVVSGKAITVPTLPEALAAIAKPEFDPRSAVVLMEPLRSGFLASLGKRLDGLLAAGPSTGVQAAGKSGATVAEYGPRQVIVTARTGAAGYLILSDSYYPGWKAWVNGSPSDIFQANAAFRAVGLPAGESLVEFRYDPLSFKLGVAISVFFLAVTLVLLVGFASRSDHRHTSSPQRT